MAEQQVVKTFFVTLRRSFIGRPWFHKRTLESLGFKRRMQCVEKPNNAHIRAELTKIAHLVRIETDQMYYNRKLAEFEASKLREPIFVSHPRPDSWTPSFASGPARAGGSQRRSDNSGSSSSSSQAHS